MVTAISSFSCDQPPERCSQRWLTAAAEAQRRLATSPYHAHRQLRCSFRAGALVVQGRVSSYFIRQMAWALVADIDGVDQFVDRIEVVELLASK